MKSFTKFILPQTGLFTIALILISAIYKIVGNSPEKLLFINLLIIIGGGLLLSCVEYYLLPSVWQASARRGLFFSCLTWYVGIGVLMLVTGWVGFSIPNLIAFTIDFLIWLFSVPEQLLPKKKRKKRKIKLKKRLPFINT